MKLFLDDVRNPSECFHYMYKRIGDHNQIYLEKWEVVRNFDDFTKFVQDHYEEITYISFDHDLADVHYDPKTWTEGFVYQEKTGADCARWLKYFYLAKKKRLPTMFVHSMNPVGTENIINIFK